MNAPAHEAPEANAAATLRERRRTVGVYTLLGALLVATVIQGRNEWWWPINAWPVYSSLSNEAWAPVASAYELDVVTSAGETSTLRARELADHGRREIIAHTITLATLRAPNQTRRQARAHLLQLLRLRLGDADVREVTVRQRIWQVNPQQVPPVQRDAPLHDIPIARFDSAGADLPSPPVSRHGVQRRRTALHVGDRAR